MGKNKIQRFAEMETFANVFQHDTTLQGKWHHDYFNNPHPITLELGCGRGEYTVNLARLFPKRNFIGIDIKGARLWRGAKTGIEENLKNVAFLRIQIENIATCFDKEEVAEIWITFPDPQPQLSRIRKRLTHPRFLESYKKILQPNGLIHLKTDNDRLYEYTLQVIKDWGLKLLKNTANLYESGLMNEVLAIQTTYEKTYRSQGKNINYLCFSF